MNMDTKFSKIETEKCVYCAICVPKCPTYQLSSCETESPRGRVIAINQLLQGNLTLNARLKETFDNCLQCGLCQSACPAKIATPKLISIIKNKNPSKRYLLFLLFTRYSHIFSKLAPLLKPLLPTSIKNASKAVSKPVSIKELQQPLLFLGCSGEIFESDTKNSSIELLKKINIGVTVSKRQYCCGSLHYHQGDFKSFAQLQDFNYQALKQNGINKLLYLSSGCKLGIKAIAEKSAISTQNIIDFLFEQDFSKIIFKPLNIKVAVFIPCTHRNNNTKNKITALLKLIPQLKINFITGSCCGSAGVHFFDKRSFQLRNQILSQIEDESMILTTNIGCRLHLARGVMSQNRLKNVKIIHPSFLLNQQCS